MVFSGKFDLFYLVLACNVDLVLDVPTKEYIHPSIDTYVRKVCG